MGNVKLGTLLLLLVSFSLWAEMPMSELDYKSLGVSYTFEMNGFITESSETSASMLHLGGFHYAPMPYLMVVFKFGVGDATTTGSGFETAGDYGFAFQGGLSLYTPKFAKILQVTGGSYFTTFNSDHSDGYIITRNVRSNLGLRVDAKSFINFEAGAKHNYIFGKSTLPQFFGVTVSDDAPVFGYLQMTLHHPKVGAFAIFNAEFGNGFTTDDHGIYNGVLSVTIGTVLKHRRRSSFSEKTQD